MRFRALTLETAAWLKIGQWTNSEDDLVRDRSDVPVETFAAEQLQRRWRKVRKRGKTLAELDPRSRHRLRIQVKKLRYATEFFSNLFAERPLKGLATALAAALAIAPACAQVSAPINWILPSAYPINNFHTENLVAFAKDLADATNGKLAIKVYPNASLFPAAAIKSAVRIGQAQVGEVLISLHDNEDPLFGIDVVPFLASSFDEARKLWAASKPAIERRLATQGLMVLFAVPWPPQGIYSNKEINDIIDMKGLSWRVYNASTQRIAEMVDAYPVTIQAADLKRALATGLINALLTSGATGYDVKVWENMGYFYDTQAWLPKNVTFVNKAAFDRLDKPMQEAMLKVAAAAEARGWWWSQDKTKWYIEQLAANGIKVLLPSQKLKAGLKQIGEHLAGEWVARSGAEGQNVIKAYRQ